MALLMGRRLLSKRLFSHSQKRHGYIVLVPEIGEDLPDKNPLLQDDGLPQFSNVTIENCMAAIGTQTLGFEADVKKIESTLENCKDADIFQTAINPLEKMGSMLDMTWGLSKTLYLGNSSLMPTKSYLAIHDRAKRARAAKYNSLGIYEGVSEALKKEGWTPEEERVLRKYALEGKLNGLEVLGVLKEQLKLNLNKLLMERNKFKMKFDVITKKFSYKINDPQVMRDFPPGVIDSLSMNPGDVIGPWMITLQPEVCVPFLEYCPDREMRWNVWHAGVSRGSGYGDKEYETSTNIEEIRFLRRDQAKLLGYDSFADMSMETKMAGSVANVQNTINTLLTHVKPIQDREVETLHKFATERGFRGEHIELWDYAYWKRKHCMSMYDYSEEKLQEYFPLGKVLSGLLELCELLFDVKIKQRSNISTWHKDVKFYDIFESHSSAPVAGFYFDPYARSDLKTHLKKNNGWMVGIQNRSKIAETKPLGALVFNFPPATPDKPSLLSFRDLQVLFHKFGQMLQHTLSRTTYSEVSGLSNIEWDAVDVSGNVLSNWLFNKFTMDKISSHYLSEDKLPAHMHESLINSYRHCAATDLCTELYYSSLDLLVHSKKDFWLEMVKELWPQYRSFPLHKTDSHMTNFTPIFIEEWAAAYYSRIWSKMIAADVYSAFHEVQGEEKEIASVGQRFRETFLAVGGSCHPNQVFRNFRGRDPSPKALLASLGLKGGKSA